MRCIGLLLAAVLLHGDVTEAAQRRDSTDFTIGTDIVSLLNRYDRYTIFDDVAANVRDGFVTLTGKVTDRLKAAEIERQVSRIAGVKGVQNQIDALPASKFDDQIRNEVYRAIYGHQNFLEYGLLEKPPIHILVEGGHVTLTGTVYSDADRTLAQSLAMQVNAQSVTNRLKTPVEVNRPRTRSQRVKPAFTPQGRL
jgi:osmotically-inducible protein OsmY